MKRTNDLKKGTRVKLRNGWEADLLDNLRGNVRYAKVYGYSVEAGSIYGHDIVKYYDADANQWFNVEHTKEQEKARVVVKHMIG